MVVSSSFIQALPELLTTEQDLNSSSSDLESLLAAWKTTNGFKLGPSVLAAKQSTHHTFFMSSCFQTDFAPCLSIAVLDTMSFQTDLSSIAIILEGSYEYLSETL